MFYSTYADAAVESRCARCLMRGGQVVGAVYLMDYDTDQGAFISALQTNVLRISLAIELGIVLMAFVFSAAFSRRLRRILFSVHKMRDGDYSTKIELHGHDELNQLGREFNELADRLTESEARRRQFVSDASHELKTPLASIKLLADSVLQNSMDPETEHEFIGDIAREADRLGRLSQKLLMLTKLDSQPVEEREILDAAPVAEKVLRMLRPLAALRAITVEQTITPGCTLMTVEDDLYQIVFNLVEKRDQIQPRRRQRAADARARGRGRRADRRRSGRRHTGRLNGAYFRALLPRGQGALPRGRRRRTGAFHRPRHGRAELRHDHRRSARGRRHGVHRPLPAV